MCPGPGKVNKDSQTTPYRLSIRVRLWDIVHLEAFVTPRARWRSHYRLADLFSGEDRFNEAQSHIH